MMNYGTEIAANGSKIETINQLQNFRTDKEVVEYLEKVSNTFKQYQDYLKEQLKYYLMIKERCCIIMIQIQ